ncbi:hypothetical protein J6590_005270 [Homalodisca vitripennis]|nr:hypothetical protein J6590_005270 [Homalodisca vitripennis]
MRFVQEVSNTQLHLTFGPSDCYSGNDCFKNPQPHCVVTILPQCNVEVGGERLRGSVTATVGLVVHAAVDGVALGAAATTTQTDVEMIVFIAIMLHKAPAAFGLVTFLMHEGIDRKRIRRHLLIFSLAAPLLALITYFGIGQEGKETLSSVNATGIAMLFSAGTFLYVATVHVLPELTSRAGGSFKPKQLMVLVLGTMLPLVLTQGHHH